MFSVNQTNSCTFINEITVLNTYGILLWLTCFLDILVGDDNIRRNSKILIFKTQMQKDGSFSVQSA